MRLTKKKFFDIMDDSSEVFFVFARWNEDGTLVDVTSYHKRQAILKRHALYDALKSVHHFDCFQLCILSGVMV